MSMPHFHFLFIINMVLVSLQAWGVRKITLVDNGKVAMSNPLRQSLYTLEDCLNGGQYKAIAAERSLKSIFPVVVYGVKLLLNDFHSTHFIHWLHIG